MIYSNFFSLPILTKKDLMKKTNFPYSKISKILDNLVDLKLLYKDDKKRNSKYYSYDILELLRK